MHLYNGAFVVCFVFTMTPTSLTDQVSLEEVYPDIDEADLAEAKAEQYFEDQKAEEYFKKHGKKLTPIADPLLEF